MNCEYVRKFYNVPAEIGLRVEYKGRLGTIQADGGNYVNINFDDERPGHGYNIHPTDPGLIYLKEKSKVRQMTRGQKKYREYLRSEDDRNFSEWLGIRKGEV